MSCHNFNELRINRCNCLNEQYDGRVMKRLIKMVRSGDETAARETLESAERRFRIDETICWLK